METFICIINPNQNKRVSIPSFTARHSEEMQQHEAIVMLFLFQLSVLAVDKPCSIRSNYPFKETSDLTLLVPLFLSQV